MTAEKRSGTARAMILAAGRGERMRPLTDTTPKPLLPAGGRPLIVRQIEALARAGFDTIAINVAWLGERLVDALGDGSRWGVSIAWSREPEPLEAAGGIAHALPLLRPGPIVIVSGDVWTDYDYRGLAARIAEMERSGSPPRVHLVMVPNPVWHAGGDFAFGDDRISLDGAPRCTYGNIGIYDSALFAAVPPGSKAPLLPLLREWIARGLVSGELYDGAWVNAGTPADLAALDASLSDPGVGAAAGSGNPLLDFSGLPRFDLIEARHIEPAIDALLARARAAVAAVVGDGATADWEHVVAPTETPFDELDRAFAIAGHLNAVASTGAVRAAYNAVLPRVTGFDSEVAQDPRLHARYRQLADGPGMARLSPAQQRVVTHALRDFRLGGAGLEAPLRERLKAVREELATLAARFDDNVLDAEDAWSHHVIDEALLAGVPDDVKAAARDAARAEGLDGWKLTLKAPCYQPVMRHAANRALRATMHRAVVTVASERGETPQHDNGEVVARVLALRDEEARLLGHASYAGLSLATKMAGSPDTALAFLRDLAQRVHPFALRDRAELSAYAREELGIGELAAWDIAWAAEKLRQHRFALSEEEVRAWLPLDHVLAGLFRLVEKLYGVSIREDHAPVWHPAVRFYAIKGRDGAPIGQFYLDLFAREGKQGGAWMDEAINRRRVGASLQRPLAWLTCNFPAPLAGAVPHLTHRQVITLFHEFGHGLHLLLTRVDVAGVSGLQEVEWDAVELPSQIMENFCWNREVLDSMAAHATAGGALPDELYRRMLAARNFGGGMALARQLELALFDLLVHGGGAPATDAQPPRDALTRAYAILDGVRAEVAVEPYPPWDRFIHHFDHVFAGDYAAGYYSYLWAEVMAADAFDAFEEAGGVSPAVGARFRDAILAVGGTRPALESFVAFRGRPPQLDALLRHNGLVDA